MANAINGIDTHTYLVKEPARAMAFSRDTMGLQQTAEFEQGGEFELPDGTASFILHQRKPSVSSVPTA